MFNTLDVKTLLTRDKMRWISVQPVRNKKRQKIKRVISTAPVTVCSQAIKFINEIIDELPTVTEISNHQNSITVDAVSRVFALEDAEKDNMIIDYMIDPLRPNGKRLLKLFYPIKTKQNIIIEAPSKEVSWKVLKFYSSFTIDGFWLAATDIFDRIVWFTLKDNFIAKSHVTAINDVLVLNRVWRELGFEFHIKNHNVTIYNDMLKELLLNDPNIDFDPNICYMMHAHKSNNSDKITVSITHAVDNEYEEINE